MQLIGLARAELVRRDTEYAETQEAERRTFQQKMFNAESDREVKRKQFDEALAERQMAHATRLAAEQQDTARSAARAAKWAAVAAVFAAAGTIVQAIVAAWAALVAVFAAAGTLIHTIIASAV